MVAQERILTLEKIALALAVLVRETERSLVFETLCGAEEVQELDRIAREYRETLALIAAAVKGA